MNNKLYENEQFADKVLTHEQLEDCKFVDCEFVDCTLDGCRLLSCSFNDCRFIRCTVSELKAVQSQVKYCEFSECLLSNVDWESLLPSGRFAEPISRLDNCKLKYNTFRNISFRKFNFAESEIVRSIFAECNLCEANLNGCALVDTEFFMCDLQRADFRDSFGYRIDTVNNRLKGAKFTAPEVIRLLDALGIVIE